MGKLQLIVVAAQIGQRKRIALLSGNGSKYTGADRYSNQYQRQASCVTELTAETAAKSHLSESRAPAQSNVALDPHIFVAQRSRVLFRRTFGADAASSYAFPYDLAFAERR
jgi:hypothetical protein